MESKNIKGWYIYMCSLSSQLLYFIETRCFVNGAVNFYQMAAEYLRKIRYPQLGGIEPADQTMPYE